jgi:hypothetical protein
LYRPVEDAPKPSVGSSFYIRQYLFSPPKKNRCRESIINQYYVKNLASTSTNISLLNTGSKANKKNRKENVRDFMIDVLNCLFYDFNCSVRTGDFTGSTDYALAFIHWTGFFFPIDVNHFEDCNRTCVHTSDASCTFF